MNKPSPLLELDASTISFEKAFARLEIILEQMNGNAISLDNALELYEEAESLIAICCKRLNEAERKIETLVKNRQGELVLDNENKPIVHEFRPVSV